jgi:hypothetical protein
MAALLLLLAAGAGACFAQFPPSGSSSYAAKVITQSGQVSVFKDTQPWGLSVGDSVQVRDLIVTGGDGHAILQVSDGSTFEVFPNSRVIFRKNPPNWHDVIDVMMGRVRIQIQHFGTNPNPNRIRTPTAVISVRGTILDVSVDDDDETTLVEVEEGQVEVQHALLPRGNAKLVSAGETLKVYRSEPIAHNIDKGTIMRQVLRSLSDMATTVATRTPSSGGAGAAGGVGDTGKTPPPPPPPPPAQP